MLHKSNHRALFLTLTATFAFGIAYFWEESITMFVIRRGVWFVKGLREYTKDGYDRAARNFKPEDLQVDCTGKSYLITGSNSGIGKSVATEIAKHGGIIHMVCRNKCAADEACNEIKNITGNQNVHVHILDLSNPRKVMEFVKQFELPLDVLVNNAGCMVNTREIDADGLEKNFATNVLGTYMLTIGLIPLIEKSSDGRVIAVSSGGMLTQKLNPNDLQNSEVEPFDGRVVYSQNKRAQIIMSEHLARKYPKIQFSTMHPGWADTPAVRTAMPSFYESMKNRLRSSEEGADTVTWLAISNAAKNHPSGLFYQDRVPVSTHLPLARTQNAPEEEEYLMKQLQEFHSKYNA